MGWRQVLWLFYIPGGRTFPYIPAFAGRQAHIHCIVPAAGYSLKGKWKTIGNSGRYLYPVHQLSAAFRGKFLYLIKKQLTKSGDYSVFSDLIEKANKKKWVVNTQAALVKPEHVIKYLGQYTHRVAITNHRIVNVSKTKVTFIAKDYRDNAKKKPVTLEGEEFLRRFCMHDLSRLSGFYQNVL